MLHPKRLSKALIRKAWILIIRAPTLKRTILLVIHCVGLNSVARNVHARLGFSVSRAEMTWGSPVPLELANLTSHARQIYAELKPAIERSHKERG